MPLSLVPKPAAFVLIRIDAVATLQSLNDPIATAAAAKLPSRKYVAYVSKAINAFDWKALYHTYAIQLMSPTVPAPCEDDCIGADMYTPVFPAAMHPLARAPLQPTKPLPWPCYQPSFMRSVVRVPVRLEDDASAVLLEPAEAIRQRRILADEDARRARALHTSTSTTAPATDGYVNFSDLDGYIGDVVCPIDVDCTSADQYYADSVEASRPPSTCVVVDVSYDLSELDELPDPLEFFEEKRRLKQLEAESKARKAGLLAEISTPPEAEDFTEPVQRVDPPMTEKTRPFADPEALWPVWEYRKFPELLSSVRIFALVVQEVATQARRLSAYLARIKEEGLHLLQAWTLAVRFNV
ncbi:hypothetical protein B0H17DRAFT_1328332 [Mycena rosella]|uniref:Uncharacterized protein n=1 Tax=Mycena rosella TaxID=1033263 RepID=A0AAD7GKT3_MYCRO|nr:hypothetical protein B0H17DRAFT_1328332 [Mycena rosella]